MGQVYLWKKSVYQIHSVNDTGQTQKTLMEISNTHFPQGISTDRNVNNEFISGYSKK